MKKILFSLLFLSLFSCKSEENFTEEQLSGTWKLGDKTLTFINTNFQYKYNDVLIGGYFTISDNIFEGLTVIKRGQGSSDIGPEIFSGTINISEDKLIFSNFTGTWNTVFYSSYKKE